MILEIAYIFHCIVIFILNDAKLMKLLENYNSARQKYGAELVESLTQDGLPPQFLLSACRFISKNGIPQQYIVSLFKDWMKYVIIQM